MPAAEYDQDLANPPPGLVLIHHVDPNLAGLLEEACRQLPVEAVTADRVEDCAVLAESQQAVCIVTSARHSLNARLVDAADRAFRRCTLVVTIRPGSDDDAYLWRKLAWGVIENPTSAEDAATVLSAAVEEAGLRREEWDLVDDFNRRRSSLTSGEEKVLEAIVAGKLNKQIANELSVSIRTVEQRRRRVFCKMDVPSAVPLADRVATVRTLEGRQARRVQAPHFSASTANHRTTG